MKRITMKDIAEYAGVSVMTVSRVVNNKPNVDPKTRKRILMIIEELGYHPNLDARSLRVGKSGRLGVIVSDIRNPFYAELVGDIEDIASMNSITIIVTDTNKKLDQEIEALNTLYRSSVDSIIIAPEGYYYEHIIKMIQKGVKIVSFGIHFEEPSISEVWIDELEGGKKAGKYLKDKGVEDVFLIMGNPKKFTTRGRVEGFKRGFEKEPSNVVYLPVDWKYSYEFVKNLDRLPEAFFCYNDLIASGVITALRDLNIKVGRDILVVGYDDVFIAEFLSLTTLRIPKLEMIKGAFEMINSGENLKLKYTPELVIRESA